MVAGLSPLQHEHRGVGWIDCARRCRRGNQRCHAGLSQRCLRPQTRGRDPENLSDLLEAVQECALERIRPVMMTALANILGLIPVMWATGTGADVMKRLAAPMVGGVMSAMLLTLVVIPALYVMWMCWSQGKQWAAATPVEQ